MCRKGLMLCDCHSLQVRNHPPRPAGECAAQRNQDKDKKFGLEIYHLEGLLSSVLADHQPANIYMINYKIIRSSGEVLQLSRWSCLLPCRALEEPGETL